MDSICFNGEYIDRKDFSISFDNRGFRYGDAFFETIRCHGGLPLFWDDHYFRIAASFLLMKMNLPHSFDVDFFKILIQDLLLKNHLQTATARVRISFFRAGSGYYTPLTNNVDFLIESESLQGNFFELNPEGFKIGFYKDNLISKNILSNLKSNNRIINVLSSIYMKEHDYDDVLLINFEKNIVETTRGNLFIVRDDTIYTPLLEDGCVDGVIRKILIRDSGLNIIEKSISFSDILNAEEVFFTNVVIGVNWVEKLNNRIYQKNVCGQILQFLNSLISSNENL